MEIRSSLAHSAYTAAKPALTPEPGRSATTNAVGAAANEFAATLKAGEETAQAAIVGKADPHALVMALTQTELAVETAATLRDRVVEAYQEILRMPV